MLVSKNARRDKGFWVMLPSIGSSKLGAQSQKHSHIANTCANSDGGHVVGQKLSPSPEHYLAGEVLHSLD